MRTLSEKEMLEIRGGDWSDLAKGSLLSAGIVLAMLILLQVWQFCRFILSGWRNWRRSGADKQD
jgi:hypothetical protein